MRLGCLTLSIPGKINNALPDAIVYLGMSQRVVGDTVLLRSVTICEIMVVYILK